MRLIGRKLKDGFSKGMPSYTLVKSTMYVLGYLDISGAHFASMMIHGKALLK